MSDFVLGVDLGGTDTKFAVMNKEGRILRKQVLPTEAARPVNEVVDLLAVRMKEMIGTDKIIGIGLGVPAPMNSAQGLIYKASNLGADWVNVPIREMLQKHPGIDMPILLNNDANAAAWGEYWLGAGRGAATMILFTLGTGVGGGIVVNGKLHGGADDAAGELGHMIIELDGAPCGCGQRGCVEAYGSTVAIRRMVRDAMANGELTNIEIPIEGVDAMGAKAVFDAAVNGDALAVKVLAKVTRALGVACGNVIHIFNPDIIVFSGGMSSAGEFLFDPIRRVAKTMAFDRPGERIRIVPAELGNDAGVIGNAGLVYEMLGK